MGAPEVVNVLVAPLIEPASSRGGNVKISACGPVHQAGAWWRIQALLNPLKEKLQLMLVRVPLRSLRRTCERVLFLTTVGMFLALPSEAGPLLTDFRIETPVAGADLHSERVVLALKNCKSPKGRTQPDFRTFLDGVKVEAQVLIRSRTSRPESWWLGVDLPKELNSEQAHRLTVEAVCGERARVATLGFTWRTRGGLETALGLARKFRVQNRSDSLPWGSAHGALAWGMNAIREFAPVAEQRVLGDWLQGYHRGWSARPEKERRIELPGDLLPGFSLLGLVYEDRISQLSDRVKELVWFLKTRPLNDWGAIDRWGSSPLAWARAKGMAAQDLLGVGGFAAQVAVRNGDRDLLEFAARQPAIYAEKLRDPISGLYHQVWLEGIDAPQNRGDGFNLRASAQVLYAFVLIAELLPKDHPARASIDALAVDLQARLAAQQLPGGGFPLGVGSRYLEEEEVSTSAWVGAAIVRGVRAGILAPATLEQARAAWSFLVARVEGSRSTGDLPEYDIGPIARLSRKPDRLESDLKNAAHGVGPVLLLAAELQGLGGL